LLNNVYARKETRSFPPVMVDASMNDTDLKALPLEAVLSLQSDAKAGVAANSKALVKSRILTASSPQLEVAFTLGAAG
jgi:hypothetical protein